MSGQNIMHAETTAAPPTNLMSLDRASMESLFDAMGEKRFHARQVLRWIYQRDATSFDQMTDLGKSLRARLGRDAGISPPEVVARRASNDGTRKWLLQLADGNRIETVFIPEAARGTLCVSSQAGCALGCTFCATARGGFHRNLSVDEIIGQVWLAKRELAAEAGAPRAVTNIVLMGMGEPLLNFDNVVAALRLMTDDCAFGLSRRRVTLSTAGLAPAIERLGALCPVSLAVSLHAPDDELRTQLVPLNKKYPLARLLAACRRYAGARRQITFEYTLLDGVNAAPEHARALARLLGDLPAKVNLIPFNPSPGITYRRPPQDAIDRFRDILLGAGVFTATRKTRGDDIGAACGQLAGKVLVRQPRRGARAQ